MSLMEIEVDVLIIGGGLTGLMYGLTSVEEGHRVTITESHCRVGGYATHFMRNKRKYDFDCSQHKITGIGINGNLRNALQRVGIWDAIGFKFFSELTTVTHKGKKYVFSVDGMKIKEMLLGYFPKEQAGIEQLFEDILTHGYQNYMFARMLLGEYQINKDILPESRQLSNITTKAYFRKLFFSIELIEVMSSLAIYLGTIANEANAMYFLHFLYAAFYTSPGYVEGTGQKLSDALGSAFVARGGEIVVNNPLLSIEIKEGQIVSATSKKIKYITNKIVATCAPEVLISMFKKEDLNAAFVSKIAALPIGWGHYCLYVVSKKKPEDLGFESSEYLLVADEGDDVSHEDIYTDSLYERMTLSVTNYHQMNPNGGYILQFIVLDHDNEWFKLEEEKYLNKKNHVQELILRRIYKSFPLLQNNIEYIEASTPRTNFSYTNSPKGSAFGYKALPKENMRFLYNPPVNGLKLIGGWSTGPGYETAMCLGFTHSILEKRQQSILKYNNQTYADKHLC